MSHIGERFGTLPGIPATDIGPLDERSLPVLVSIVTAVMIRAMAAIAQRFGWQVALASMAIGPLLGIWAMSGLMRGSDKDQAN